MNKIIHFIKYNNSFSIGISLVVVLTSGAFAASPDLRENIIASQEIVRSVDNSGVMSADIDNFSFGLQIKSITEDAKNYYLTYSYNTLVIQDYVWQEVEKEKNQIVSKEDLQDRDLGIYVAEELGEIIESESVYLKEVKRIETEKGITKKIVATEYSGLIGKFFKPEEKTFEGYAPVAAGEVAVVQSQVVGEYNPSSTVVSQTPVSQGGMIGAEEANTQQPQAPVDRNLIRQIVQDIISQQPTPTATPVATVTPTATPTLVFSSSGGGSVSAPNPTPTPLASPEPTAEAGTPTSTPTATPEPTATPTATPTSEPTPTVMPTATPEPTATPTATPTPEPTATPTVTPTPQATATPEPTPTATPEPSPAP